jgi:hypothetical protein
MTSYVEMRQDEANERWVVEAGGNVLLRDALAIEAAECAVDEVRRRGVELRLRDRAGQVHKTYYAPETPEWIVAEIEYAARFEGAFVENHLWRYLGR